LEVVHFEAKQFELVGGEHVELEDVLKVIDVQFEICQLGQSQSSDHGEVLEF
jgi:hypothetical protein